MCCSQRRDACRRPRSFLRTLESCRQREERGNATEGVHVHTHTHTRTHTHSRTYTLTHTHTHEHTHRDTESHINTYPHTERKMHARGRARIQKGDDSWCATSSFCIGGEFVYTELWGRSSANEPVLYMIRHNGASVCVRCLGHDFDEWELPSSPMMMMMMMMSMIVMMRMLMRVRMRSVFFLHSSNSRRIQLL